jgi:chromosome partitioning protein
LRHQAASVDVPEALKVAISGERRNGCRGGGPTSPPGADTHLARLAHSFADTLITLLNDSFVDFDVLGTLDPVTLVVTGEGTYAQMVREARRHRREIDFVRMDWVVVRNRMSQAGPRKDGLVGEGLEQLAARLGFRCLNGFTERVIYRELFPRGLTALDPLESASRHAWRGCARRAAGGLAAG